jgi:hypothetical protein
MGPSPFSAVMFGSISFWKLKVSPNKCHKQEGEQIVLGNRTVKSVLPDIQQIESEG